MLKGKVRYDTYNPTLTYTIGYDLAKILFSPKNQIHKFDFDDRRHDDT